MAIAPGQYPFTGGAVVGGGGYLTRDDIKSLVLTRYGEEVGTYNPGWPQSTSIDLEGSVIVIADAVNNKMSRAQFKKMHDAIDADQPVVLNCAQTGGSNFFAMKSHDSGGYTFFSMNNDRIRFVRIGNAEIDADGHHQLIVEDVILGNNFYDHAEAAGTGTMQAGTYYDLFTTTLPADGLYFINFIAQIKPAAAAEYTRELYIRITKSDNTEMSFGLDSEIDDSAVEWQAKQHCFALELPAGSLKVSIKVNGQDHTVMLTHWAVASMAGASGSSPAPVVENENFYGTTSTPYSVWYSAFQSGKTLFLTRRVDDGGENIYDRVYRMSSFDNNRDYDKFYFSVVEGDYEYYATVDETDYWFIGEKRLVNPSLDGSLEKLLEDIETKLNTSMDMSDIEDCYDMAANANGVNGNLLGFAFTIPINSPLRLAPNKTHLSVYAKQNYSTKVIIGLYEYNFDGNNGAGQTLWVCDTGPVNIVAGRNDFPITHLRSTDRELKSERVYYASIYFPNQKTLGCYLAGKPGYNDTVNAQPRFTMGADNINLDMNDPASSLEDTGFWAGGYNERPSIPRFLLGIRNADGSIQPPSGPFDNLTSFTIQNRTLTEMGFTDQPYNNGMVFKKVVPREAVTIKKWKWIDDQSTASWGHGWLVCDGVMAQLVNSSSDVTFVDTNNGDGTYTHEATHNSGIQLQAENVYWFPVQGNTSNQLNATLGGYSGNKQDNLRCCQSGYNVQWGPSQDLNTSNAYLYLEDNDGNGWTI